MNGTRGHPDEWQLIRAIASNDFSEASPAFDQLCSHYWPLVNRIIQARGFDYHESQDLTQGFFLHLLKGRLFARADPAKGRLVSFLTAALGNFLCNEWDSRRAWKRGGKATVFSLSDPMFNPVDLTAPMTMAAFENTLDRAWALMVTRNVLMRLKDDYASKGKVALFEKLESELLIDGESLTASGEMGTASKSNGSMRVALHRFRRRFGWLLRTEIARCAGKHLDIDDGVRAVLAVISER